MNGSEPFSLDHYREQAEKFGRFLRETEDPGDADDPRMREIRSVAKGLYDNLSTLISEVRLERAVAKIEQERSVAG